MSALVDILISERDLSEELERDLFRSPTLACDLETSGLDWRSDKISICQVYADKVGAILVRIDPDNVPTRLARLISSASVRKVFHHAAFDLRFMQWHWGVRPANVACTKVASKITWPEASPAEHSLKPLLEALLGVAISKEEQLSNWDDARLTEAQLEYAANDVRYLMPLLDAIASRARGAGVLRLIENSFAYLPTRVETDLRNCGDVFSY